MEEPKKTQKVQMAQSNSKSPSGKRGWGGEALAWGERDFLSYKKGNLIGDETKTGQV
jgi:hypothetical protein